MDVARSRAWFRAQASPVALTRILGLVVLMGPIAAAEVQLPNITDQSFIDSCVKAHNGHRAKVKPPSSDMLYMTWDKALAESAWAWARSCKFSHNPFLSMARKLHPNFHPVGENLWVGDPGPGFSAETAVQKWADEVNDFDYSNLTCRPKKMCGHYKQVVWAKSYKVGCAVHICPNGVEEFSKKKSAIFVCNYGNAGNFKDVHPYRPGAACSECAGDQCEKGLCRDSKRDEVENLNWRPDWGPGATSSASRRADCLAVLLTRPLSLLLIFAGVLGLQVLGPPDL
ncbi:GLIPR1-like protein 1 [Conger conger]|uniref:GLIPR1-like protein 1 n=1 Tax=Conger conger TaxID=82655 RepID=UPI002A5AF5F0|nr:GLIPR1-like protein 1 [Conger conger]